MGLKRTVAPVTPALSSAEASQHLGIIGDEHGTRVAALVEAATQLAENYTGRAFVTQTWVFALDSFPLEIRLPRPPLQSVTSIQYIDPDGTQQTLASSGYRVSQYREPATIEPAYSESWPTIRTVQEAIEVTYVTGYGDTESSVPDDIKHAIKLIIGEWDEFREGAFPTRMAAIPHAATRLLDTHRVGGLFVATGLNQW